jgi:transposase
MSTDSRITEPVSVRNVPLPTLEQLPDDPATLKGMVLELLATLHGERRDRDELRQRLDLLLRRLYGPKTERFNPDQLLLFGDDGPAEGGVAADTPATAAADAEPDPSKPRSGKRRARPHGRRLIPDNLPREPLDYELSDAERICCCGQTRIDIGVEQSEQLAWRPAAYFVWQHRVHKYLCPHCAPRALHREDAAASMTPATATDIPLSLAAGTELPLAAAPAASLPTHTAATATSVTPTVTETIAPAAVMAATATGPRPIGPAIVSAVKPASPLAKGLAAPSLLAHIIVSKYADHLPLYRQENISEREGVFIPRSTSCDWLAACAELLRPLYELMVARVLQSAWLHTDDTSVKNLGHQPGATALSRFWIYWGERSRPYNVFDFTINRNRDGPQTFLANYRGYLHADAFSGYDGLYLPNPVDGVSAITEVACNAHARRKFYEARGSDAARAHQALAYYRQLYELERRAKDNQFDDAQRLQMRQELAVPILTRFHGWLEAEKSKALPKSPMAAALGYALNNWTALSRYTEAGFLAIDNNTAEREMKRIAIGRKNWLHVGSDKGGRTAAVLFSFTSTCHRLGVEPWAYLTDVLTRLPATPLESLSDLLPDCWQAARTAAAAAAATTTPSAPASVD